MKLSEWARKNNLSYQTAHTWFKSGKLPVKATQTLTGTILINEVTSINPSELKTYIYCRVSTYTKKEDLNRQADRCKKFCHNKGWEVERVVKEISSGMNDKRKKLLKLFDQNPKRIVVEHKDRLTRFGFNYFEHLLPLFGYELIVMDKDTEEEHDLMKDLIAVITSFCCRLYGLRKAQNKIKKIKPILQQP